MTLQDMIRGLQALLDAGADPATEVVVVRPRGPESGESVRAVDRWTEPDDGTYQIGVFA
jgi:hypothetical protein